MDKNDIPTGKVDEDEVSISGGFPPIYRCKKKEKKKEFLRNKDMISMLKFFKK